MGLSKDTGKSHIISIKTVSITSDKMSYKDTNYCFILYYKTLDKSHLFL